MKNNDRRGEVLDLVNEVDFATGAIISKTLLDHKAGTLTLFSFDQGQGLSEHTAPFDATIIVTEGEATVIIDGKPRTVRAGEMVIMPANIPHAVEARSRFKMLLVMIREKVVE